MMRVYRDKNRTQKRLKGEIEVIILSVGEPQLNRCLESINTQTVKFDSVKHLKNISPLSAAMNKAFTEAKYGRIVFVHGDMILYPDAFSIMLSLVNRYSKKHSDVYYYRFGVKDTFIDRDCIGIGLYNTDIAKKFLYQDVLRDDVDAKKRAKAGGYKDCCFFAKHRIVVGTHFDDPDEFQVFKRFYIWGSKFPSQPDINHKWNDPTWRLEEKYKQTKNTLYLVAMESFKLGAEEDSYKCSLDIDKQKKRYDEWKNSKIMA